MARLSDEEIEERRSGLEGWERDGDAIQRTFDLEISWNKVTVSITTHSEGGSPRTTSSWPAASTGWPEPMLLSASSADERRRRSSK